MEAKVAGFRVSASFGDGSFPFIAKGGLESAVSMPAEGQESALARTGADLNVVSQRLADP